MKTIKLKHSLYVQNIYGEIDIKLVVQQFMVPEHSIKT